MGSEVMRWRGGKVAKHHEFLRCGLTFLPPLALLAFGVGAVTPASRMISGMSASASASAALTALPLRPRLAPGLTVLSLKSAGSSAIIRFSCWYCVSNSSTDISSLASDVASGSVRSGTASGR